MAKITITIEDTQHPGLAAVSWNAEPEGVLYADGTPAEQIAYYTLKLLARAGSVKLPTVEIGEGEGN